MNKFRLISALLLVFSTGFNAFSQSDRPIVTNITSTQVSSNQISISWQFPYKTRGRTITSIRLYKNTRPITSVQDIASLTPIAKLPYGTVSYNDTIADFREYYYAVITLTIPGDYSAEEELYWDEELDAPLNTDEETPYLMILPGVNATVTGTRLEAKLESYTPPVQTPSEPKVKERDEPLPFIDILADGERKSTISTEAKNQALSLTKPAEKTKEYMEPYVFEEDYISPFAGDEYLLFDILKTTFILGKYKDCERRLNSFLAQNRNPQVTLRAKFYLAECLYFNANLQDALNLFLELDENFHSICQKWIESCLDLYEI